MADETVGAYGSGGSIRSDFIPADRYNGKETTALEKTRLWPKVWQIACREEELPQVGNFVTYEIADESIVIVRSSPTEIKAYYNVCQHRGRRLVDQPKGRIANFYCRFHGWKWALDGEVTHVYNQDEWAACPQFKNEDLALKQPKCESWAGWIWINMDPEAEPLLHYLGDVAPIMEPFDFADLRRAWHVIIKAPVNWKVVIEAFNEGYHSGATHSTRFDYVPMRSPAVPHGRHAMYFTGFGATLPRAKREDGSWKETASLTEMLYYQCLELHEDLKAMVADPMMKAVTRLYKEMPADAPPEQVFGRLWDLHKQELEATGAKWPPRLKPEDLGTAGTSWHLFPNTIFLPNPDAVLWYRMRPDGDNPDSCIFDIWCLRRYAPGKEPEITTSFFDGFKAAKGANTFLEQDFDNMVAVNEGMKSRGWLGARTNPAEEATIVNFHREIDKLLLGNK